MKFFLPIGVPYTALEKIALPFTLAVWIWILIVLILACICRFLNFSISMFDLISVFLGGGVTQEPQTFNLRFVLLIWLYATIILRTVYHGVLFDIMQLQVRGEPIDTIGKVTEHNYLFHVSPVAYDLLYYGIPSLRDQ